MESLAAVAMHPHARAVIAKAKQDLDMAARRLTQGEDPALLHKLDARLALVERRAAIVREAIASQGPFAIPQVTHE